MKAVSEIIAELAAPFPSDQVDWRVGSTNKKKFEAGQAKERKGQVLCFIDARDVMGRLDGTVGPENWQDRYEVIGSRTFCYLSIKLGGEWITKADAAGDTDVESEKGAVSDAFKRAAVKWSIGRYLYNIDTPWIVLDDYWSIPREAHANLRALLERKAGNAPAAAPKSAYAARKDGDYPRFEKALRDADTLTALMAAWKGMYPTIKTWPQGWIDQISDEKNRCKDKLMAQMDAAAE